MRTCLLLALLALLVGVCGASPYALDIVLIEPSTSAGPETLLVCIPGMGVPASEYVSTCKAIRDSLSFRTWVAIMSFAGNAVTPLAIERGFDMAAEAVRKAGFTSVSNNDTFVWAHSAGGAFATMSVASRGYAGFVLFGSYLSGIELSDYPVPAMVAGGELDGLMQITRLAEDYRITRGLLEAGREREAIRNKPVVAVEGMNHAQMCNNFVQEAVRLSDFEPEISLEEAVDQIALLSSSFISMLRLEALAGREAEAQGHYEVIRERVLATNGLVAAFLQAQDEDQGEWCRRSQIIVANLGSETALQVSNVQEPNLDAFADSKASLEVVGGVAVVVTHSFLNFSSQGEMSTMSQGQAAVEACCKCKSQESIVDALKFSGHGVDGKCKDVNLAIFDSALKGVSQRARERYLAKGRQLLFLDDASYPRGDLWLASHLVFDETQDPVHVMASRLTSANIPTEFGGATYCKGVAAARIVSWIMHDSLPRGL